MNVAMITDTHFGVKNDSPEFIDHQLKFYREQFFPTLGERGITVLFHLGDIFDRRKYTNHNTLHQFRAGFFDLLVEYGITMYLMVGNHDTYYKSTNSVNSPELFLDKYIDSGNVVLIDQHQDLKIGGEYVAVMPWINAENYHESLEFMEDSKADVLMGHFEIRGFEMHRGGGANTSGLRAEIFAPFDRVFSGHFHEPNDDGRIMYLGAPYEYTWADYGCTRGFYIFDLKSHELEYIRNTDNMFYRITYDEHFDPSEVDVSEFEGKIVRVIVADKMDNKDFEKFVESIEAVNTASFEVIDNRDYIIDEDNVDKEAIQNEDTLGIIKSYVEETETVLDKDRLNTEFKNLYMEALAVE